LHRSERLRDQAAERREALFDRKCARCGGCGQRGSGFPARRVSELVRFFTFTYGPMLPDDDAGREDLFILAQHVVRLNGDPEQNIRRHAAKWAPWMAEDELNAFVRRVLARRYRYGGPKLGQLLRLLDRRPHPPWQSVDC
jgi:hypothetical protein